MPRTLLLALLLAAPVAHAGAKKDVLTAFATYVERQDAFDPATFDSYADDAVIHVTNLGPDGAEGAPGQLTMDQLRPIAGQLMEQAKASGDRTTYGKAKAKKDGDRWVVSAPSTSGRHCRTDPDYHAVFAERDGAWKIVEEHITVWATSACADAPDALTLRLTELADGLRLQLPLELDEDSRVDGVSVEETALVMAVHVHTLAADDPVVPGLGEALTPLVVQGVCQAAVFRQVIDLGGTIRYDYRLAGGEPGPRIAAGPGDCD